MNLIDAFMDKKEIKIACEGTLTVSLDELRELQHYKDLTDAAYQKGKASILKLGFSFPIFIWEDKEGTKWIIDAHQRKRVLMRLRSEEGYFVPALPAVRIFAKDRKEAKEKILAQESQYGDITEEGMYEFIHEEGFELNETELEEFVDIPVFDMEQEAEKQGEEGEPNESCETCLSFHNNNHQLTSPVE